MEIINKIISKLMPRWFNKLYADFGGYFWLPCPICGKYFGGHEWFEGGIMTSKSEARGVCPRCVIIARVINIINGYVDYYE